MYVELVISMMKPIVLADYDPVIVAILPQVARKFFL
jgi:hypothetical protein